MMDLLHIAQNMKSIETGPDALPIYRLNDSEWSIFYTPGLVATVSGKWSDAFHRLLLSVQAPNVPGRLRDKSERMLQRAKDAKREYSNLRTGPFEPECLMLYLHNQCNLECKYCLRSNGNTKKYLHPKTVRVAAELVARNCRKNAKTFTTVFHGWGEPTYDFPLLQSLVRIVDQTSQEAKCSQFRYIATNGILSPKVATFLANHFEYIGLSCDGPPDIQNRQRPMSGSGTSSDFVERTATILKKKRARYSVRATITRTCMNRQEEITDYILRRLFPDEIYFEPAYRMKEEFRADDAEEFLKHYQKAATLAAAHGVPLTFSGSRMFEVHGPYCNVFRKVLNVTPENEATACFASEPTSNRFTIGKAKEDTFQIHSKKIRKLQTVLSILPEECCRCFNRFHCVGICPEQCNLNGSYSGNRKNTFRCRLQLLFGMHQILAHANEKLKSDMPDRFVSLREIRRTDLHFFHHKQEVIHYENR